MTPLNWEYMLAVPPKVQQWGALDGQASFIITFDYGCHEKSVYYNRYAVSRKLTGSLRLDLGLFDTLNEAKAAAEATRGA